jgi:hypothetical protein
MPSFEGGQHLARAADHSHDVNRPNAAPPHLKTSMTADSDRFGGHQQLSSAFLQILIFFPSDRNDFQ